jgi:hypothetical protein
MFSKFMKHTFPHPQSLSRRERDEKPFSRRGKGWEGGKNRLPFMKNNILPMLI